MKYIHPASQCDEIQSAGHGDLEPRLALWISVEFACVDFICSLYSNQLSADTQLVRDFRRLPVARIISSHHIPHLVLSRRKVA